MSNPQRPAVILDKNVLQGLSPTKYQALAERFRLVMPDVLFFECLKGDPIERARCFGALPAGDNPIALTHHLGYHLQHEIQTGQPLGLPSDHLMPWDYHFNPRLRNSGPLPPDVEESVESARREHLAGVPGYVGQIQAMHRRLNAIMREQGFSRMESAEAIRAGLLDLSTVRDFLREARDPDGNEFLPPLETLGSNSAIVVHFQVTHALALQRALDHGGEYEKDENVTRLVPSLARELFDANYLMLGVLESGLATQEKRLRRIFEWLRPDGVLWPPPANLTTT
jgi:hypothetical protein